MRAPMSGAKALKLIWGKRDTENVESLDRNQGEPPKILWPGQYKAALRYRVGQGTSLPSYSDRIR